MFKLNIHHYESITGRLARMDKYKKLLKE